MSKRRCNLHWLLHVVFRSIFGSRALWNACTTNVSNQRSQRLCWSQESKPILDTLTLSLKDELYKLNKCDRESRGNRYYHWLMSDVSQPTSQCPRQRIRSGNLLRLCCDTRVNSNIEITVHLRVKQRFQSFIIHFLNRLCHRSMKGTTEFHTLIKACHSLRKIHIGWLFLHHQFQSSPTFRKTLSCKFTRAICRGHDEKPNATLSCRDSLSLNDKYFVSREHTHHKKERQEITLFYVYHTKKKINVAPQNFSSGSHNGQLPMAHNQLVRILNCRSRLKCRAPGSLLEVNGDKEETLRTSKCWVIIGAIMNQFVSNVLLPQAISFTQKDKYGKWKVIWCQWPARNRSE